MSHRSSALILAMLLSGALTLSACYEDTEATGPAPVESTAASGGVINRPGRGKLTGSGPGRSLQGRHQRLPAGSAGPGQLQRPGLGDRR